MAAVADNDVADVADHLAVDENFAGLDRLDLARAAGSQFQHVAIFEDKSGFFRHTEILGQTAMAHEVAILAVNRYEVAGPRQLEHGFQFLLAGMTRDMIFA